MDIFEYAMQMEKDGEVYYRENIEKCNHSGLKHIFKMLADDEVKHYELLKKMKDNIDSEYWVTDILKNAKNIFIELQNQNISLSEVESEKTLYQKAMEIEKKSEDFYRDKAKEVKEEKLKKLLLDIAEEEKRHYFLLDNMLEFISRPETWLEDAEFNHLDEY